MLSGYSRATESEIAKSAQFISISLDAVTDKMSFIRWCSLQASSASWSLTFKPQLLSSCSFYISATIVLSSPAVGVIRNQSSNYTV